MKRTIFKYPLSMKDLLSGVLSVDWTGNSRVVHSEYDNDRAVVILWVLHEGITEMPIKSQQFGAVGTGWNIPEEYHEHVATHVTSLGYVWHIFKVGTPLITIG